MRRPIIAMNLKNYVNKEKLSEDMFEQIKDQLDAITDLADIDVYLFPSLGNLHIAKTIFKEGVIRYGAQNIAPEKNGAYTGEYSIESLMDNDGSLVEIGHYERLTLFGETTEMINKKIKLTIEEGLTPLICVGSETELLRQETFKRYMTDQLTAYFDDIKVKSTQDIVLAYEPGWAIGQSEAAPVELVHENHALIRAVLRERFGQEVAAHIRLIYGGSVSKDNATALISCKDVDGLFIGRFGHDPKNFRTILEKILTIKMR